MKYSVLLLLSLTAYLLGLPPADAQANVTVSGFVFEKDSSRAIFEASISVVGGKANTVHSDSDGKFILIFGADIKSGSVVRIHVEKEGYQVYEKLLPISSTIPLDISLTPTGGIKSGHQPQPAAAEREMVSNLINSLCSRRVFYYPYDWEHRMLVHESLMEIRTETSELLKKLSSGSLALDPLKRLRREAGQAADDPAIFPPKALQNREVHQLSPEMISRIERFRRVSGAALSDLERTYRLDGHCNFDEEQPKTVQGLPQSPATTSSETSGTHQESSSTPDSAHVVPQNPAPNNEITTLMNHPPAPGSLSIDASMMSKLAEELKQFRGQSIELEVKRSEEAMRFADKLEQLMRDAGIRVSRKDVGLLGLSVPKNGFDFPPKGISITFGENRTADADAFGVALLKSRIVNKPITATRWSAPDKFLIYIRSPNDYN
jgi:hypothetical protein